MILPLMFLSCLVFHHQFDPLPSPYFLPLQLSHRQMFALEHPPCHVPLSHRQTFALEPPNHVPLSHRQMFALEHPPCHVPLSHRQTFALEHPNHVPLSHRQMFALEHPPCHVPLSHRQTFALEHPNHASLSFLPHHSNNFSSLLLNHYHLFWVQDKSQHLVVVENTSANSIYRQAYYLHRKHRR